VSVLSGSPCPETGGDTSPCSGYCGGRAALVSALTGARGVVACEFAALNSGAMQIGAFGTKWSQDAIRPSVAWTYCGIPTEFRRVGALSECVGAIVAELPTGFRQGWRKR